MSTPYITPEILNDAATGIAWNLIPDVESSEQQLQAEQMNICWRATSIVDSFCNQVLRATIDNEELTGPGSRGMGYQQGSGLGFLYMRRWPVSSVLAIQVSPNWAFPRRWTTVPATDYEVNHPLLNAYADTASATAPDGGSSILVKPCHLNPGAVSPGGWVGRGGRNSVRMLVSYTNGWPHTSLTSPSATAADTVNVDDVTGWAGAAGFVYDGSSTQSISVTSVSAANPVPLPNGVGTAQAGPGVLTLSSPLSFPHAAGTLVSSLPANVMQATILAATVQALESGIDSITAETLPGSEMISGHGVASIEAEYKMLLGPYRRII